MMNSNRKKDPTSHPHAERYLFTFSRFLNSRSEYGPPIVVFFRRGEKKSWIKFVDLRFISVDGRKKKSVSPLAIQTGPTRKNSDSGDPT
jgi:hypothetical protein